MEMDRGRQALLAVLGVSAGVATGVLIWRWRARPEEAPGLVFPVPRGSAQDVAEALRGDARLSSRRIEVDTIAEGVVELSGSVRTRAESERAVGLAQRTTGVYTVVNRLDIEEEESHRDETRRRWADGAPELRERHHYGMGVGMGTRRQSPDTDPDRPSDKQHLLDRALDVPNVEEGPEGGPDPVSGADSVDDADIKAGDERSIEEAGLDPAPRPTSTPREGDDTTAEDEESEGRA